MLYTLPRKMTILAVYPNGVAGNGYMLSVSLHGQIKKIHFSLHRLARHDSRKLDGKTILMNFCECVMVNERRHGNFFACYKCTLHQVPTLAASEGQLGNRWRNI